MEPLISIIVPNYNAEKYIERCIESIENQSYSNTEVIIVDDGSTDSSWNVIQELAQKYNNVHSYHQENMNAAIARNRGIEIAKGAYILFLDSDDVLLRDSLYELVTCALREKSDLVIGNYLEIDENEHVISEQRIVLERKVVINPMELVGIVPNPSTKLYKKQIIMDNCIIWGNVRIGQDLNFFLKYLSCCWKVSCLDKTIYGWRFVKGSISNSYNFRIFDIIESFKDTKKYYYLHGKEKLYDEYISAIEYRHYYLQMEKQKFFQTRDSKKVVVDYFKLMLKRIDLTNSRNANQYKEDIWKCKLKMSLAPLYTTNLYFRLDKKFARRKG